MAVPFHSVDTEDEARNLIASKCSYTYKDDRGPRYIIPWTWAHQDVSGAIHEAAKAFDLADDAIGRPTDRSVPPYQFGPRGIGAYSLLYRELRKTCEGDE